MNGILTAGAEGMNKYLCHAWYAGGVKALDTETGVVSSAPGIKREDASVGVLWKQQGRWFAFHGDDTSLMLQSGSNIWRVQKPYTVRLDGSVMRKFRICEENRKVFSIRYVPRGLIMRMIDPTYDAIDQESDDFFLYVKNMWERWRDRPYSEFTEFFGDQAV